MLVSKGFRVIMEDLENPAVGVIEAIQAMPGRRVVEEIPDDQGGMELQVYLEKEVMKDSLVFLARTDCVGFLGIPVYLEFGETLDPADYLDCVVIRAEMEFPAYRARKEKADFQARLAKTE